MLKTKTPIAALLAMSLLLISSCAPQQQANVLSTTIIPISVPQKGQTWSLPTSATASLDMIWIPRGSFMMGSPRSEPMSSPDERPQTQSHPHQRILDRQNDFHHRTMEKSDWPGRARPTKQSVARRHALRLRRQKTDRARFHAILPRRRSSPISRRRRVWIFPSISSVGTTRWNSAKN